jgi:hypothetical protein
MPSVLQSPHTERILANLQYQGSSNDCGPYSAATVICALRDESVDGDTLAKQMNKPRRRKVLPVVRRVPNWATFPWGVADVLREYGLDARWWLRTPIEYLRPALANGHVLILIIGEWRPKPWAHFMTLVAWGAERGWGFANTQFEDAEIFWVPDDLFRRRWRNYGRVLVEIEEV